MLPVKTTAECPGHDVLQWTDGGGRRYAHCYTCKSTWEVVREIVVDSIDGFGPVVATGHFRDGKLVLKINKVTPTPPGFTSILAAAGCFDNDEDKGESDARS